MAKKNAPKGSLSSFDPLAGWGNDTKTERAGSGTPLVLDNDSDAVLQFRSKEDISAHIPDDKKRNPDEKAYYLKFWDGKQIVSMPMGYASSSMEWESDAWYYVYNKKLPMAGNVNDMNDLYIRKLGSNGASVQCPPRISDNGKLKLEDSIISKINYERLNYPLRQR